VRSAYIVGRACAINGGKNATMIQSFGPEARDPRAARRSRLPTSRSSTPTSTGPTFSWSCRRRDTRSTGDELKESGRAIYEKDLVHPTPKDGQPLYGVPSDPHRGVRSVGRSYKHRHAGLFRGGDRRSFRATPCEKRSGIGAPGHGGTQPEGVRPPDCLLRRTVRERRRQKTKSVAASRRNKRDESR